METIGFSLLGYVVIGLLVGAVVSNIIFRDGGDLHEAYQAGLICWAIWPLAVIVAVAAALWFGLIKPIMTPRQVRLTKKADYQKSKQEALERGEKPPNRFITNLRYED